MWLSIVPVSGDYEQTELSVLMRRYVEAVSGTGGMTVQLSQERTASTQRRFATRMLHEAPLSVSEADAHGATFEVANVDQMQLTPSARWRRSIIVLIRPAFRYVRWDQGTRTRSWPMLIIAGYSSGPERFSASYDEFVSFVQRVQLLSDSEAMKAASASLFECYGEDEHRVTIELKVEPDGTPRPDIGSMCLSKVLEGVALQATGQPRRTTVVVHRKASVPFPEMEDEDLEALQTLGAAEPQSAEAEESDVEKEVGSSVDEQTEAPDAEPSVQSHEGDGRGAEPQTDVAPLEPEATEPSKADAQP